MWMQHLKETDALLASRSISVVTRLEQCRERLRDPDHLQTWLTTSTPRSMELRPMRCGSVLSVVLALVYWGCAGPVVRRVDEQNHLCVLSDGTQARYVPASVKQSGAHPRISGEPPASGAVRGVYDCLISAVGVVTTCRVLESVGTDDQLVIDGLSTWRFEPARCADRAIDARTMLAVLPRWIPSCVNVPLEMTGVGPRTIDGGESATPDQSNTPRVIREDGTCLTRHGREAKAERPQVISGGKVTYSKLALEHRQQGLLTARCLLRRTGEVENCRLVCSDVPLMEGPVLDALATTRMEPARCAGEPFDIDYVFNFRMELPAPRRR